MGRDVRAIAMISGGLDSTLALALVKRQGIEVKAINFYTGFCITETQRRKGGRADGTVPRNEALRAAADLEVDIEYVDISGQGYLDMLVHPKYGYGANANPCVDCRIFMMRRAREIMEQEGAAFVFTGEVLGQRPKSQRRDTLRIIERESGLDGRLLRPLSAKLLPPTIPEREGLVDRARLEAKGVNGPVAIVEGEPTWEERVLAARIVARYGKGKDLPEVEVEWREGDLLEAYRVAPEQD